MAKPEFQLVTYRGDGPKSGVELDRPSSLDEADDIAGVMTKPAFQLVTYRGDGPKSGVELDRPSSLDEADDIAEHARRI